MMTNLIPALGWTLLHSLWQGALLFLLIVPLLYLLKNRSPQVRYWLACGTTFLLVIAMAVTFSFQFSPDGAVTSVELPVLSTETPVMIAEVNDFAQESEAAISDFSRPVAAEIGQKSSFSLIGFLETKVNYLVALWGLGALLFVLKWCNTLLLTYRLRNHGIQPLETVWEGRLDKLKNKLSISRRVSLMESAEVDSPLIIGHFKPLILLPIGLLNGLSVAQVEAIIAHELAHIRRNDFAVNFLLTGLEVILFYHPVYWWLVDRINQERELCCDDIAVTACGSPRLYAQTLLQVEEHRQAGTLALAFADNQGHLLHRIKRICQAKSSYRYSVSPKFWLLFPLLAWVMAVAWAGVLPVPAAENLNAISMPVAAEVVDPMEPTETQDKKYGEDEVSFEEVPGELFADEVLPKNETSGVAPLPAATIEPLTVSRELPNRTPAVYSYSLPLLADTLPPPTLDKIDEPEWSEPPALDIKKSEVEKMFSRGEEGHRELRRQINAYGEKVNAWRRNVDDRYLETWGDYLENFMDGYEEWRSNLRAKSDNELAYALVHEQQAEFFKDALEEVEDMIQARESSIDNGIENQIEMIESVIKKGERKVDEHSERMRIHSDRMSMHSIRMKVHSTRMQTHSARMKVHSARMKIHSSRMKSHGIIMAALEAELETELIADGLLERGEKYYKFEIRQNEVIFNGRAIEPASRAQKYRDIITRYGKGDNLKRSDGASFIIEINRNGKSIGTRH